MSNFDELALFRAVVPDATREEWYDYWRGIRVDRQNRLILNKRRAAMWRAVEHRRRYAVGLINRALAEMVAR